MQRAIKVSSVLIVAALLSVSAHSACGGGGYSVKSSTPVKEVRSQEVRTEEVRYQTTGSTVSMNRLDSVSDQLNLSREQTNEIASIKRDSSAKISKLQGELAKAQSKYDRCNGRCEKESRKLEQAKSALSDAHLNFDRRLSSVLSERQMRAYVASANTDH